MYRFRQIFKMDLLNLVTNPMWLFYNIGFPLLLTLILGFLNSGAYGGAINAYDYYGVAMLIFAVFNTATIAANSFMEERIKSPNLRLVHSPIPAFYIHLSKLLATFVFSFTCHLLVAVMLSLTAGVSYSAQIGLMLALLLLSEFFASALGVMLCCACKSENLANQILSFVITMFAILGGLFFPLDGYGAAIEKLSYLSPVKWVLTASFQMIYDGNNALFLPAMLVLAALSALSVFLCVRLFRTEDYL